MLGQVVVYDIFDAGDKGGCGHEQSRDKGDKAIGPSAGMFENEDRAYAQRQRRLWLFKLPAPPTRSLNWCSYTNQKILPSRHIH